MTMENIQQHDTQMTLEYLVYRKRELKKQISRQEAVIQASYKKMTSVFRMSVSPAAIVGGFTKGFAIFDGLMLGIRMIRKLRRLFRR